MGLNIGPHGFPMWVKDPAAVKDYTLDWTAWLGADTISSSTWTVPTGLIKVSSGSTDNVSAVWLGGGTVGERYLVSNKIVTSGGRTEVRSFEIHIKQQ